MEVVQSPAWPVSRANCDPSPLNARSVSVTASVPVLEIVEDSDGVGPSSTSREPKSSEAGATDSPV